MKLSTLSAFVAVIVSAGVDTQAATVSSYRLPPSDSTASAPVTVTGTSYPTRTCIVLVSGTGSVVPSVTASSASSTFTAYDYPTTSVTASSSLIGNPPPSSTSSSFTAYDYPTTSVTASSSLIARAPPSTTSSTFTTYDYPPTIPSSTFIFGTVYTTAPGQATTVFGSSYIGSFPTGLPICPEPSDGTAVPSPSPSPTGNGSSLADTAGGSPKSAASTKAVGFTAAMLSVGAALVALVL